MTRWFIPNPASAAPGVLAAQVIPHGSGTQQQSAVLSERMREFFFPDSQPPVFFCCTREGLLQMVLEWFSDRSILMIVNGPMSQEWYDIADDCRAPVAIFDSAYGTAVDPEAFGIALKKEKYDLLMFADTDVYLGSRLNAAPLCARFRETFPDGLIAADISGSIFCGNDSECSGNADICLCGSEIALGLPPGLGLAILNERAHTRVLAHNMMNGRYFNYQRRTASRSLSDLQVPPYTLLNALDEQINIVLTEGMNARVQRLMEVRNVIWDWINARGFSILAEAEVTALNCTSVQLPTEIPAADMADFAARYGVFLMPGIGQMSKNSIIIYHGNDTRPEDAAALTKVLDRFLSDYDTRRRRGPRVQRTREPYEM